MHSPFPPSSKSWKSRIGLGLLLNSGIALVFSLAAVYFISLIHDYAKEQALAEAEDKARLILDRNLATHTYFSHHLKPAVFKLTDPFRAEDYFEPTWMSSTYAVRKIDNYFQEMAKEEYYYKECAINARSPENEADVFERAFIEELNVDPELRYRSQVRAINGKFYFVTMRRGEVMEESCLRCHSTPENAPAELVNIYGGERSFNRNAGEVVSAISIRVPLTGAYEREAVFARELSLIFFAVFVLLFAIQYLLYRTLVGRPLSKLQDKAVQISRDDSHLGEVIDLPAGSELHALTAAFNSMSSRVRYHIDHLEEMVKERTAELQNANTALRAEITERKRSEQEREEAIRELERALMEIKTLQGILPLCSFCKKVRDDKGYWEQVEVYISRHTQVDISHGVCPECFKKHYPDEYRKMAEDRNDRRT